MTDQPTDEITIKLTRRAAEFYVLIVSDLGGDPDGPRKEIEQDVTEQLEAQGVTFEGLPSITKYFVREVPPHLPELAARWPEIDRSKP